METRLMSSTAVQDPFDTGCVVIASLAPATLSRFDPMLRRLLAGTQLFVKHADGRYHPKGCALGLPHCFEFSELVRAEARSV
ncbi:MAG: hypothetical protein HY854_21005 [Burkholderiales bacterium]|nr:hypothetical protein [Burkholderiales bacterium]